MRMPDGEALFFGSLGFLLCSFLATGLAVLIGYNFTSNTPTYCYVEYSSLGADAVYPYRISQHRTFGVDLRIAAARTPTDAAEAINLLCK